MEALYGIRRALKEAYRTNASMMSIAYRCTMIFIALLTINNMVGMVTVLKNPVTTFVISLLLGMLPLVFATAIVAVIAIVHIFKISMLVGIVCAIVFSLLGILSLRLAPGNNNIGMGSFIFAGFGGTFAAPVALSMTSNSMAVIPMVSGLLSYRVLEIIKQSKAELLELTLTEGVVEFLQNLMDDKILILTVILSSISYLTATVFKILPIVESWKIGLIVAALINVVGGFLGEVLLGTKIGITTILLYSIAGIVIGLIIEVFVHNVEYRSTEVLNFEDDEYFYYVKAVPKKEADKSQNIADSKIQRKASTRTSGRNQTLKSTTKNNGRSTENSVARKKSNTTTSAKATNKNRNTNKNKTKASNKRR